MRLIPQDILLEIFFACLPTRHNAPIDHNEAPLLLGRICRHWREVAYSAPMLWSSIHIPPLDYILTPSNILLRLEKIVEEWLERSATCPLSVSVYDFVNRSDPDFEPHPLILQIAAVSRRLRSLTLAGDADLMSPLLRLEDLPRLKTLRVRTLSDQILSTDIFNLPALEDAALCTILPASPLSLPLRWSQLTGLRLGCHGRWTEQGTEGGLDFDGALEVLRKCPNVEQCRILISNFSESVGLPSISLPRLHTLALTGSGFQFRDWSSDLVAPNLRFLQIGELLFDHAPRDAHPGCLKVEIDPNRFTLTSLHKFLQSFPAISHLRLSSDMSITHPLSLDDQFIAVFCPPHNLCPMLVDIAFVGLSPGFSDGPGGALRIAGIRTSNR
ncbi:hypothetical protein MSAN_01782000 [Mycena sanguinolenta]|uniref:F-box domain-containing protein n=1 Tax=Mycena sanguinolenta TaxID=230812 RepID=A0A8H7CUW6_9AGAR|nr:hypothetical protein MSAN_01782000 [Mycena sanguinolenta]